MIFCFNKVADEDGANDVFERKLENKLLRVVNNRDPCVPLPPESAGFSSCLSSRSIYFFIY